MNKFLFFLVLALGAFTAFTQFTACQKDAEPEVSTITIDPTTTTETGSGAADRTCTNPCTGTLMITATPSGSFTAIVQKRYCSNPYITVGTYTNSSFSGGPVNMPLSQGFSYRITIANYSGTTTSYAVDVSSPAGVHTYRTVGPVPPLGDKREGFFTGNCDCGWAIGCNGGGGGGGSE